MRLMILVGVTLSLAAVLAAQDPSTLTPGTNSISALLASQEPQLQFGSADDLWMLYDWRFDLLSNGAQEHLLKKYGYLDFVVDGLDRAHRGSQPARTPAIVAPRLAGAAPGPVINVRVSQALTEFGRRLQSETTIAVNGSNIVVGFNDGDLRGQAVAFSRDAGTSWSYGRLPSYPGVVGNSGDPTLAFGPNGRLYHSYLAANAVGFLTVALAYSDDGGATWNGPVNASASLGGLSSSLDKSWLAVDNVPGSPYRGNIYVACTRFTATGQDSISFVRSADGGNDWSQAAALTTLSASEAAARQMVQGSFIAIGPGGEVYVSWYDSRVDGIRIVESTDGGVTFSQPVTALSGVGFASSYYIPGTFDVAAFGQIAVDTSSGPNRGAVYVTANALNTTGTPNLDVMLAHSGDGGLTWDPPVRVNNDNTTTSQFQPAIAVAANGNVGVAFYDRRNDPNDVLTDVYLAISSDAGKTFPTQQRATTENWLMLPTPIGYRTGYHGDYNGIVSSGGSFFLSWGDDRNGTDPDVYMTAIPVNGSLPDFTVSATKPFADILPGDSATFSLQSGAQGVKVSASVYPAAGITAQVTGSTLTATSTAATAPGTYTITVTGDNGSIQRSTEVRVTVHPSALRRVPTPLTSTADPGYNSQSVADSQGNVHVVISGSVVSRRPKRVTYIQIPANGTPLAPVTLASADVLSNSEFLADPHVAVSSDGRIYVVWRRSNLDGDAILLSVSTDKGKTFSAPTDVSTQTEMVSGLPTQVHAFQPSITVGKNGAVFISFLRENAATISIPGLPPGTLLIVRIDIAVIHSTDGGSTFSNVAVPSRYGPGSTGASVSTASPPALALDSSDNPYVTWAASITLRGTDIYVGRSRDGGATFEPAVNITNFSTPNLTPRQPAIALDPADVVYVSWNNVDLNAGLGDILLSVSTDGVTYNLVNNISNATYYSGAVTDWPAIKTDTSGNLIVVWREWLDAPYRLNDTQRDIFFARCSNLGASCSTPTNISTSLGDTLLNAGGGPIQPPGLAVDASGKVHVFYDDDTSGSTQVMMWTEP